MKKPRKHVMMNLFIVILHGTFFMITVRNYLATLNKQKINKYCFQFLRLLRLTEMIYQKNACAQECSNQLGSVSDGNLQASSKPHSKKVLSLGYNGKFNDV